MKISNTSIIITRISSTSVVFMYLLSTSLFNCLSVSINDTLPTAERAASAAPLAASPCGLHLRCRLIPLTAVGGFVNCSPLRSERVTRLAASRRKSRVSIAVTLSAYKTFYCIAMLFAKITGTTLMRRNSRGSHRKTPTREKRMGALKLSRSSPH